MKPKTHIQEKLRRMSEQQKMLQEKKREIEEKLAEQKRCFYQQDGLYNHLEYVESINNSKQVPVFIFNLVSIFLKNIY